MSHVFTILYMKEVLNSDWLRAVQFKTSVSSVQCKLHIVILDYDQLAEGQWKKSEIVLAEVA